MAESLIPLTAEEMKALIEIVPPGTRVTFPNGITVDKRPMTWLPPIYPVGTQAAQGYLPNYWVYLANG